MQGMYIYFPNIKRETLNKGKNGIKVIMNFMY